MEDQPTAPAFGPLVELCKAHGIGRSTAFELSKSGALATFCIGSRRYVTLESLRTLPARMAANDADDGRAAA